MIVDCHVNIFEDRHVTPLMREQTQFARPGSIGYKADADTLYAAMKGVDKAIIFSLRYADSTGQAGVLPEGGVEWMQAGGGVWHTGEPVGETPGQGFQLWVALPAALESAPAFSRYLAPSEVQQVGPARVLLGHYGTAHSVVSAPSEMTYLAVALAEGERWRYTPPAGHTVAWVAVASGRLRGSEPISAGELVSFASSQTDIDFIAESATQFVLGSAVPHPHPLVMGSYSVHTSTDALARGEIEIRRIRQSLHSAGQLG